ncbi:hypothetical protein KP509_32G007700 [Ceratopteris richardii]|uniref:Peptidase S54 rhomboid domain-containing protein n=1 Tax=Ceratopteris richardii TaxID=49495 RepID=A0A8T2QQJ4_CERRI|nr:hypothetical protein KP509_32G007700 [Ceratopteris richardii]
MSLVSRICRTLRRINVRSSHSEGPLRPTDTLGAGRRNYKSSCVPFYFPYDSSSPLQDGLPCYRRRLHLFETRQNSCVSGLRAVHLVASSDYLQLGYHRNNAIGINGYKFNAVSTSNYRSISSDTALWFLVGSNISVFLMWYKLDSMWMSRHFVGYRIDPARWIDMPGAFGASGAVTTLVILHILMHPNNIVFLWFVPMPAAVAGCALVGMDLYRAYNTSSGTAVGAHLGGALQGLLVYLLLKKFS